MIFASHTLSDSRLHQTRKGGKHVDRREHFLGVQLSIQVNLSLRDVSSKIGNGMCDIIVGHGKDGELSDGTISSDNTSSTLVDGGKIGIHITGVTSSAGHLLSGGRHLTQGIGIRRHISQDAQHVEITLIGQVLGRGEGKTRSNDTLNGRIIGKIQEKGGTLHGTRFFEVISEKSRSFHVHTHGSEYNGEILLMAIHAILQTHKGSLTTDLRRHFIVRKTSGRKQGNLLSTGD
mmetsp:Transcript_17892/g.29922  ORF Transcript_17892/g.29922 Transcript_17892/m.29922 type:complete len:233 (-) Transcript_17892:533-1231(-)